MKGYLHTAIFTALNRKRGCVMKLEDLQPIILTVINNININSNSNNDGNSNSSNNDDDIATKYA